MITTSTTYSLGNNKPISLGHESGSGGEARVYLINGDANHVAKIYHQPTPTRVAKLNSMLANPPTDPTRHQGHISIAWPTELIFDASHNCVGFVMPLIDFATTVRMLELYNPADRRRKAPNFTWQYLLRTARNLASVVEAVHSTGYVIGDLNESNLLVSNKARVTIVDCDSMQVPGPGDIVFPSPVGKPEYTPPELQGMDFNTVGRNTTHDNFGLAVLIFMLLMEGVHPYMGVWSGTGNAPTIEENIKSGNSPYVGATSIKPSPIAAPFDILPPDVQTLMIRCFGAGYRNPASRPGAGEWYQVLSRLESQLSTCPANNHHIYSSHLGSRCPWCERMSKLGVPDPFPSLGYQQPLPAKQFTTTLNPVQISGPLVQPTQPVTRAGGTPVQAGTSGGKRSNVFGRFLAVGLIAIAAVWAGLTLYRPGGNNVVQPPPSVTPVVTSDAYIPPTDTPRGPQEVGPGTNGGDNPGGPGQTGEAYNGITNTDLNLRPGPSADLNSLDVVPKGTHLLLLARDGQEPENEWIKVEVLAGSHLEGWLRGKYLTRTDATALPVEYVQVPPTPTSPQVLGLAGLGRIAFASTRGNAEESDIYVMNADGSGQHRITNGGGHNLFPDWSPDNRRIAYMLGSNPGCATEVPAGDIYVVDDDGSNRRQLTSGRCARWPRWSPDGSMIVFGDAQGKDSTLYDIYVMRSDGSGIRQLTNTQGFDGHPSWMPDGRILFVSERNDESHVYVMNSDGSAQKAITVAAGEKRHPSASHDGTRFSFSWFYKDKWNIYVMASNGDWIKKVTDDQGRNLYSVWSPDGRWVAFHSNRDEQNNYEIYVVPADGGPIQRLTNISSFDDEPAWSW